MQIESKHNITHADNRSVDNRVNLTNKQNTKNGRGGKQRNAIIFTTKVVGEIEVGTMKLILDR